MSEQTTLTENAPMILDATCSFAKIWPPHASIRMDKRREVKPDIVADARHLPFRDRIFQEIFCDPPHLIVKGTKEEFYARMAKFARRTGRAKWSNFSRYGWWSSREEWLGFVKATGAEFARCIAKGGSLHYKITDTNATTLADLEIMSNWQRQRQRQRRSKGKFRKRTVSFVVFAPTATPVAEEKQG